MSEGRDWRVVLKSASGEVIKSYYPRTRASAEKLAETVRAKNRNSDRLVEIVRYERK